MKLSNQKENSQSNHAKITRHGRQQMGTKGIYVTMSIVIVRVQRNKKLRKILYRGGEFARENLLSDCAHNMSVWISVAKLWLLVLHIPPVTLYTCSNVARSRMHKCCLATITHFIIQNNTILDDSVVMVTPGTLGAVCWININGVTKLRVRGGTICTELLEKTRSR